MAGPPWPPLRNLAVWGRRGALNQRGQLRAPQPRRPLAAPAESLACRHPRAVALLPAFKGNGAKRLSRQKADPQTHRTGRSPRTRGPSFYGNEPRACSGGRTVSE